MSCLATILKLNTSQGHTVLTGAAAKAYRQSGYFFDLTTVSRELEAGTLLRMSSGVALSGGLYPEAIVARWLARRAEAKPGVALSPPVGANAGQRAAWAALCTAPACTLTGYPGTGKTWLLAKLVEASEEHDISVLAAAPTGKAASVLSLKLNRFPVTTIHRLLNLRPGEVYCGGRVDADLLVIDEASMIDATLMSFLLEAVGPETRLVLVGDPHQLPPVEAGWPFADMVTHRLLPNVHLDDPVRQAGDSGVLALARDVSVGQVSLPPKDVFYDYKPPKDVAKFAEDLYFSGLGLEDFKKQALILSPVKSPKYDTSTGLLNASISHRALPQRLLDRCKFTRGDRLMFTVNNRQYGFVNGELGTLVDYQAVARRAVIDNDYGKRYELDQYALPDYAEWSYALTVHKAQGSESEVVVLMLTPAAGFMYSRNLLYTALTRAKRHLYLVGDIDVLRRGVRRPEVRTTALHELFLNPSLRNEVIARASAPDLSAFAGGA